MDIQEVKACLRALLSSTAFSYNLRNLLSDFKSMTGVDLPLFGCLHPVEFLRTLDDTVQLLGNPFDPKIALVESKKSAHITSLVDRQKNKVLKCRYPHVAAKPKRLVLPNRDQVDSHQNNFYSCTSFSYKNDKEIQGPSLRPENLFDMPKGTSPPPLMNVHISMQSPFKGDGLIPKAGNFDQEKKTHIESPQEFEKTYSCYFEGDISDNESCFSVEGSRSSSGHPVSSPCNLVNDGIRNKLKQLIKQHPKGLWCCELPGLFLEEYQFVLDYREFGYTSLIQMLSELPDIFRCIRPGNEDWIIFDASVSPSSEEKKMLVIQSTADTNREVRANLKKLLISHLKNSSDSGIELNQIPDLYEKKYGRCLDAQALGFKDLKSLLESWEESSLHMLKINGNIFVVPDLKMRNHSPSRFEAVPPVTAENDLFVDIFPKDVVGPEENLSELDLYRHVAVGHVIEVCVAEVWSPTKFYLQLNKFKNRLNRFMDDLQRFYNVHLNKYKMPNSTIRPNQVCVGLYSSEPEFPDEWHRAKIVKVINEKTVLINFVDFGTVTRVKKTQLRFLHRNFQFFPVQAFLAELSGISPPNDQDIWPMSTNRKFLEFLRLPYFKAEIIEIDFKKPAMSVNLFDPFQKPIANINKKLIEEKLAWEKEPVTDDPFVLPESDEEKMLKIPENDKKALTVNTSTAQESINKNLPNEFSDITDLSQSTLFYFQMKSLKLDNSQEKEKENVNKAGENLNATFEFEEVPDLEKKEPEKGVCEKEKTQNSTTDVKKSFTKFVPPRLKRLQNLNLTPFIKSPPSQNKPAPEFSSPPKPISFPPGLEHVNVFSSFPQTFLLMNPENTKKRINILAMEILSINPSIQQVGMNDPVLALKIATEMAEAYVTSELTNSIPHGFNPLLQTGLLIPPMPAQTAASDTRPINFVERETNPVNDLPDIMTKQDESKSSSSVKPKTNIQVKKKKINEKDIHLVILENQLYFSADEVVRNFTLISNREIADRVLITKRVTVSYRILSKKTDEEALNAIKSTTIPLIKNKTKKLKVFLIPIKDVVPYLRGLGCITKSFEKEFLDLEKTKEEESNSTTNDS